MEHFIDSRYLLFPVNHAAPDRRVLFYEGDALVYDLVCAFDAAGPEYMFPVDVERFRGRTLRLAWEGQDGPVPVEKADARSVDYDGEYRPLAHFTARRGWLNDPNGLVWYRGVWHMFFQHDPVDCKWENMHWGHAVSQDLVHWQERDIALFPDEDGTLFSGSAIVDSRNASGLKRGDHDPILLFYTCAGDTSRTSAGRPVTQRMAYSTDGGETFVKYPGGPVLEHIVGLNRDPKVVYYPPKDRYILALYLEERDYGLFASEDLLHWRQIQTVTLPGDDECPDFYPLALDGNSEVGKWVFIGAHDRYLVGDFDGDLFVPAGEVGRLNWGDCSYAAQSWSGAPDGRHVRTAFFNVSVPGQPFACCMALPQEVSLRTVDGAVKLCVWPVREVERLYRSRRQFRDVTGSFRAQVTSRCCDVTVRAPAGRAFSLSLYGLTITYGEGTLRCGDCAAPVTGQDSTVTVRVIVDTLTAEIFAAGGSVYMGMAHVQDPSQNALTAQGEDLDIDLAELGPFWET